MNSAIRQRNTAEEEPLIVLPLGVKQEFTRDAVEILGYEKPEYCRTMEEVEHRTSQIVLTNYERVRDGDIRPEYFAATSLDEASVLRSFGSKTYRRFWINSRTYRISW